MDIFEYFQIEILPSEEGDPVFRPWDSDVTHTPYETEKLFFALIRAGDADALRSLVGPLPARPALLHVGRLSSDALRQAQYLAVAFITLGTRAAIEGGLGEAEAYRLSDRFILRIDARRSPNAVLECCFEAMLALTEAVREKKPAAGLSVPVRRCIEYIAAHLSDRILLDNLAALCGLTPVYLSTLFKKETGANISQYILTQKLERAKELIRLGQYTYDEISSHLGFCSQSYFIRCFKREYGLTPREFRLSERGAVGQLG